MAPTNIQHHMSEEGMFDFAPRRQRFVSQSWKSYYIVHVTLYTNWEVTFSSLYTWMTVQPQDVTHLMSKPLTEAAAVSAMYAGAACMAKPMPNPYVTLPVSSRG